MRGRAISTHRTTPATPSTATCEPSGMRRVASSTPSTIGMPRSRASEARCEVEPPSSATTPATRGRMWLSAGPATLVTRMSPGATRDNSHSQFTTTARPEPQPMPAGWPLRPGCLQPDLVRHDRRLDVQRPRLQQLEARARRAPIRSRPARRPRPRPCACRRPSVTAWPASRHGSLTSSRGTACGMAPAPWPQVSR